MDGVSANAHQYGRRPGEEQILEFWREGVRSGFAGARGARHPVHPLRPGFNAAFLGTVGVMALRDETGGRMQWGGDVVIHHERTLLWRMGITGWFEEAYQDSDDASVVMRATAIDKLKEALRAQRAEEEFATGFLPRGPVSFGSGSWLYCYEGSGSFARFSGVERVFYRGQLVLTQYISGCLIY